MSSTTASVVAGMKLAPEIEAALKAVELPEVQELMQRLAKYNLGVCVPHMHSADIDFDILPKHIVQVEADCKVTWLPRSQVENLDAFVPVAWRWTTDGGKETAVCMEICSPNPKKGHKKSHL